jgi:hypothetical protein
MRYSVVLVRISDVCPGRAGRSHVLGVTNLAAAVYS